MAIKINGDLIISNTRGMSDISIDYQPDNSGQFDGGYFNPFIFPPEVNTITSTINMGHEQNVAYNMYTYVIYRVGTWGV